MITAKAVRMRVNLRSVAETVPTRPDRVGGRVPPWSAPRRPPTGARRSSPGARRSVIGGLSGSGHARSSGRGPVPGARGCVSPAPGARGQVARTRDQRPEVAGWGRTLAPEGRPGAADEAVAGTGPVT